MFLNCGVVEDSRESLGLQGAQGRAPWVTGIGNLEIRPRDEGERLKNETHAGSEESAVLKAASLLERRPLRPGSPSRGHRNHLPFAGHLRPGAEPRVPAGSVAALHSWT